MHQDVQAAMPVVVDDVDRLELGSDGMPDPKTVWLTVTNIILGALVVMLGALVVMCLAAAASAVVREIMARIERYRKISAELDLDMRRLFSTQQGPLAGPDAVDSVTCGAADDLIRTQ